MNRRHSPRSAQLACSGRHAQRGSSLVEVLVAMLVASIGLLAMGELLVKTAQAAQASGRRTSATLLAIDLAERLRVNRAAARAGNYDVALGGSAPRITDDCIAGCSAGAMATADLADWRSAVQYSLPRGAGVVRYDTAAAMADIWVTWADINAVAGGIGTASCPAAAGDYTQCVHLRAAL